MVRVLVGIALVGILAWALARPSFAKIDPFTAGIDATQSFERINGNVTIAAGETVENKDIHGCVIMTGAGGVLRNSKVSDCAEGAGAIRIMADNIVMEDVTATKDGPTGFVVFVGNCVDGCNGVGNVKYLKNITIRHNEIAGGTDGMIVTGVDGMVIEGNNIHDPIPTEGSHTDALQFTAGRNIVIRNNLLLSGIGTANGGTFVSGAFVKADFDTMDNILIEHNEVSGGTFGLQCYGMSDQNNYNGTPYGPPTNCVIQNNVMRDVSYNNAQKAAILLNAATGSSARCNTFPDRQTAVKVLAGDKGSAPAVANPVDDSCNPGLLKESAGDPTPTPDPPSCDTKSAGDADCKTGVSLADFAIWKNEYVANCGGAGGDCGVDSDSNGAPIDADFNGNGRVDLSDFAIWQRSYKFGITPLPTAPVTAAPTAEPTTVPTAAPTAPPATAGHPNETNTGPKSAPAKTWPVSAAAGKAITVSENADGYIFNGCVTTGKAGVHITNSIIKGNCAVTTLNDAGGSGVFEYNDIIDVGGKGAASIGCGSGSRFYRNNAKGAADGAKEGMNCKILENYIHDLDEYITGGGNPTHNDGVQIESGATTGMLIQGNTFANTCGKSNIPEQGCAGVVFINNGAAGNTVDGNYVARWDGPTAGFIFHTSKGGKNTITNNLIACDHTTGFGITSGGPSTFSNNVCE